MFAAEVPSNKKSSLPLGQVIAEGLGFMENRHLPILHKDIILRELGGSSEFRGRRDERAVNV